MIEVEDAIGQRLQLAKAPTRIVSLVPSETVSVVDLVGLGRLVGRTDYCIEPAGAIETVPAVGGTKGFDVQTVLDLEPDLVLANKEENSRPLVIELIEAGLQVHVSFPCTVADSNRYVKSLCRLLDVNPSESPHLRACREAAVRAEASAATKPVPVFVPIWRDPWMTFDGRAYASDVLRLAGARNVFAGRPRRYPLAADLGKGVAWTDEKVDQRDTRYPRVRLEEVVERGARAVLLPDEPYAFTEKDFEAFRDLESLSVLDLELIDGKDVFWYGTRVAIAIDRLRTCIVRLGR
ncbi:MAG: helical backbone metal receptor [Myxococcales bacterium]|nr:helical backbone metal receptor [Myxococcales bacterium]